MLLVSIIMPMRDAGNYIEETLQSILISKYQNIEIIIVDDGSTDNSVNIIEQINDSRIVVIQGECKGISAAFNKALNHARGDVIMRCDADDIYPEGRIEWQMNWLASNPDYDGVCSNFSMIDSTGVVVNDMLNATLYSADITKELKSGVTRTSLCTYAIKTCILKKLNGCREYFVTAEDIDLQLRMGEVANIWYEHKIGYLYRLHNASITHCQPNNQRIFFEETAREFQKQRKATGKDNLANKVAPSPPTKIVDKPISSSKHVITMLIASSWELYRQGKKKQALARMLKALSLSPFNFSIWKAILIIALR